jgi:AcrR family transcriptional regulator
MTRRPTSLGRADWITVARAALITKGIDGVRVERLAKMLGVTIGSFYWHFASRDALLDALLVDWLQGNSRPFYTTVEKAGPTAAARFAAIIQLLIEESDYNPGYDIAVRDWARTAPKVARTVRRIDDRRIGLLHRIFRDFGYTEAEAFIRARVTYFHQVGYYTLQIRESQEQRLVYAPLYLQILAGPKASGFDPIVMRKPKAASTLPKPPRAPRRAGRPRDGAA